MRSGCDQGGDCGSGGLAADGRTRKKSCAGKSITGYNEAQSAERRVSVRNGSGEDRNRCARAHGFDALKSGEGKSKIGLVTNQTGVDSEGRRTIDVLAGAPGVSLEAIFSPEHGVTGTVDTTVVGNPKMLRPVFRCTASTGLRCGAAPQR